MPSTASTGHNSPARPPVRSQVEQQRLTKLPKNRRFMLPAIAHGACFSWRPGQPDAIARALEHARGRGHHVGQLALPSRAPHSVGPENCSLLIPSRRRNGSLPPRRAYLLHFERPFWHARLYVGIAKDGDAQHRLREHLEGGRLTMSLSQSCVG